MKKTKSGCKGDREQRYFSEGFRRARVKEYEEGQSTVRQICRAYKVSHTSVYQWIRKYSAHYQKSIVKIVEEKSETKKRLALENKVEQLERFIGQQQVQIKYYEQLLKIAEQRYNVDFEKNSDWKFLNGSLPTDPNTI